MTNEVKHRGLKKVLKTGLKIIFYFIAFAFFYLLIAFLLSSIPVAGEANTKDDIDIYILTNGIHVDIVVPSITDKYNWFEEIEHLTSEVEIPMYKYLAIGWGDKGFYINTPTWSDLKASTAIKACLGLNGSAIHATYYKRMQESETCKKISISEDQYDRLVNYIRNSLEKNSDGKFIEIKSNSFQGNIDAFYEAKGRYSIFNTCNSWANRGLKVSGQRACLWTAFQNGIFSKYKRTEK